MAVVSEKEQDLILSCIHFREEMPKEYRKYLLGPIVGINGDRCFIFIPCECKYQQKFVDHIKGTNAKSYQIQFGDGFNISDQNAKDLIEEYKEREYQLKESIAYLTFTRNEIQTELDNALNERNEITRYLQKDALLSVALEELKILKGKKKILDAALKVAEEFKDNADPPNSIKILLETIK